MDKRDVLQLTATSRELRIQILSIICQAHASHIGSAYSVVDLLVYLYEKVIQIDAKNPFAPERDRFILSKGWAVSALYSILSYKKILDQSFLTEYCRDGSSYIGIATKNGLPGIEATTGSMGHGLPLGVGMALSAKLRHETHRVFIIIGDGELDEGSTWEGILQASHFKLDNLTVIVDCNGWQSFGRTRDVLNLDSILRKFESFGWMGKEIDGHNFNQMHDALHVLPYVKNKPSVVVAKTVKGKGVSIFEDNNDWHYKTPKEEEMRIALKELGGKGIKT